MQKTSWRQALIFLVSVSLGAALCLRIWNSIFVPKSDSNTSGNNYSPFGLDKYTLGRLNSTNSNRDNGNTDQNALNAKIIEDAKKARQSEARTYIGSMNRSQQAFYLERQKFAPDMPTLNSGVPYETDNYSYSINSLDSSSTQNTATPKNDDIKAYTGGVFKTKLWNEKEESIYAVLCESNQPTRSAPPPIVANDGHLPLCPSGYTKIY